jgi:hypothetical protein
MAIDQAPGKDILGVWRERRRTVKRLMILGFLLLLAAGCGENDATDEADGVTPTLTNNDDAATSVEGLESGADTPLEAFSRFSYVAEAAMGFCPDKFLEVAISRLAQEQFEFSATLVEESEDGQGCLETGMDQCLVAQPIPTRLLDEDEKQALLDTFSEVTFAEVPEWCEGLEYEPCMIEQYQWTADTGDSLQAGVDACQDPHLSAESHTAMQELFTKLSETTSAGSG